MTFLAIFATILLSLVGYSLGVVLGSRRAGIRNAVSLDFVFVLGMWAGVLYLRGRAKLGAALVLAIGIGLGFGLGWILTKLKGTPAAERICVVEPRLEKKAVSPKRFRAWRAFSYKIGTFQSQVLLGLLYLVLFAPVGLAIRLFSDPLQIKGRGWGSHWRTRAAPPPNLELFKKQS